MSSSSSVPGVSAAVSSAESPAVPPADSPAPVLLALDSATERLHLALSRGLGPMASTWSAELDGGAQASARLLPGLQGALADAGLTWSAVQAIAFGAGPGAFTGLRTACSVTQGLALGLGTPVIALDTLMAVAEDARQRADMDLVPGALVWVLQDARMGEMYVASFTWDGTRWRPEAAPALWPLGEPAVRWAGRAQGADDGADRGSDRPWVCGNALTACPAAWASLAPADIRVLAADAQPRGAALAALARQAWADGEVLDPALALPRYVRDKVAQTTAERAAAQA
jgi:tRNA threonylcarbamoyladenosine biosynthesis protein TsaB